ncbi:MAG: UDP-2,3-diacylglucosamine diphosphatase LpxI [Acidobacteria bacterium]|nr:UDP-2,3-diacylglucosamine diphosphatase LpxI [Acidobacteriota bacterium]
MRYGLIAGNGRFPFLVLEGARQQSVDMVVAAIKEEAFPELADWTQCIEWVSVGHLGTLIQFFKREGITHIILAGQVKHAQIFGPALPDVRVIKMLAGLRRKNTDSLIGAVVHELEKEGFTVIDSTYFIKHLLASVGKLTRRGPSRDEQKDIDYGLAVAREIARLDLGQTIVVRDQAVVAIEAMEGTDATILRAAELVKGKPLTVVKVAKPNQDMRFDVPVIGVPTIQTMIKAGATALSITAGKTLLLDKAELIALADEHRIAIVGTPVD